MLRILAILLVVLAGAARAFDVPVSTGHVNDVAHVLPAGTRQWLEAELVRIETQSKVQVAVLTVATLGGDTVDSAAQKVFDAWKMGRKGEDRGLLVLVAVDDRKVRIQPGYGLEGQLPDARIGAILDERAVPRLRTGDWAGGIVEGLRGALDVLGVQLSTAPEGAVTPLAQRERKPETISPLQVIGMLVLVLVLGVLSAVSPTFRFLLWNLIFQAALGGRGGGGNGSGGTGGGSSGGGGASRGF